MQMIHCGDPEFLFLIFCNLFSFFFCWDSVLLYILPWPRMHRVAQARITAVCHLARLRHHWITDISVLYLSLPTPIVWLPELSSTILHLGARSYLGIYSYSYSPFSRKSNEFSTFSAHFGVCSVISGWCGFSFNFVCHRQKTLKKQQTHALRYTDLFPFCSMPPTPYTHTFPGFFSMRK